MAGNVQEPAERQQLLASAMTAATALVKKEDVRGFKRLARYYGQGIGVQPNRELHKRFQVLKAAETRDPEARWRRRACSSRARIWSRTRNCWIHSDRSEENQTHAVPGMHFLLGYLHEEGLAPRRIWPWPISFTSRGGTGRRQVQLNNLGSMYERGTGVAKDLAEAQKWYERAAELGMKMPLPMWNG